jgi:hypothetical protein
VSRAQIVQGATVPTGIAAKEMTSAAVHATKAGSHAKKAANRAKEAASRAKKVATHRTSDANRGTVAIGRRNLVSEPKLAKKMPAYPIQRRQSATSRDRPVRRAMSRDRNRLRIGPS